MFHLTLQNSTKVQIKILFTLTNNKDYLNNRKIDVLKTLSVLTPTKLYQKLMAFRTRASKSIHWQDFLQSGNRIFIGSHAAVPNALINDLIANGKNLHDIETVHIMTLSDNVWALAQHKEQFKINALFIGGKNIREAIAEGRADYTPCFISEIPKLFSQNILPLDAALIMVSPPDEYGYCSLGVSVDVISSAIKSAKYVIAQINQKMPRTNGHSFIHLDQIDAYIALKFEEIHKFEHAPHPVEFEMYYSS